MVVVVIFASIPLKRCSWTREMFDQVFEFQREKKRRTEVKRRHGALVDAWGCRISSHVSLGRTESGENRGKHELSPRFHGVVVERGLAISEKKKRKSPAGQEREG